MYLKKLNGWFNTTKSMGEHSDSKNSENSVYETKINFEF